MKILQIVSISLGIILTAVNIVIILNGKRKERVVEVNAKNTQETSRLEEQKETDRCLLRDAILRNFKEHEAAKRWSIDDFENFKHLRQQYEKLNGNSFVDKLWKIAQTWEVIM